MEAAGTIWSMQKEQSQAGLTNHMTGARLSAENNEYLHQGRMQRLFVAPSGFRGDEQQPVWKRYTKYGHMRKSANDRDPNKLMLLKGSNKPSTAGNRLYPDQDPNGLRTAEQKIDEEIGGKASNIKDVGMDWHDLEGAPNVLEKPTVDAQGNTITYSPDDV